MYLCMYIEVDSPREMRIPRLPGAPCCRNGPWRGPAGPRSRRADIHMYMEICYVYVCMYREVDSPREMRSPRPLGAPCCRDAPWGGPAGPRSRRAAAPSRPARRAGRGLPRTHSARARA